VRIQIVAFACVTDTERERERERERQRKRGAMYLEGLAVDGGGEELQGVGPVLRDVLEERRLVAPCHVWQKTLLVRTE
jgi:hypothetical protein